MNAIKNEIYGYLDILPENKLRTLLPVVAALAEDEIIIDNSLKDEEVNVIKEGRKQYKSVDFISLGDIER